MAPVRGSRISCQLSGCRGTADGRAAIEAAAADDLVLDLDAALDATVDEVSRSSSISR